MANLGINTISNVSSSITRKIAGVIPAHTFDGNKSNKVIAWIGKNISSPQNRFILGASALMSQPFIDLNNKKVDEDTRKISAARTVAKILAGTLTGVIIRSACIHGINSLTKLPSEISKTTKFPKLKTLFTPDAALVKAIGTLDQYKKALGTIVSLFVMVITNFVIDAPLTKFLTNKFIDKIHENDKMKAEKSKEVKHEPS